MESASAWRITPKFGSSIQLADSERRERTQIAIQRPFLYIGNKDLKRMSFQEIKDDHTITFIEFRYDIIKQYDRAMTPLLVNIDGQSGHKQKRH
jgi:hypothetical protein